MTTIRLHLWEQHPLAEIASGHCHNQHAPPVGDVACGRCWELAIRDDERVVVQHDLPREQTPDHLVIDNVAIERAATGERIWLRPAERQVAIARLLERGWTCAKIADRLHLSHSTVLHQTRVVGGAATGAPRLVPRADRRSTPEDLDAVAAHLRASDPGGAAVTGGSTVQPLCESCRVRPATGSVALGLAAPFAVCDGCRPIASATPSITAGTPSASSPTVPVVASDLPELTT